MLVRARGRIARLISFRFIGMGILAGWQVIWGRFLGRKYFVSLCPPSLSSTLTKGSQSRYPNKTQWITEYALSNSPLEATQDFFNTSAEYFDRLDSVGRYSYFGSFRSDVSNVGPNAAMLTQKGELTDIGSWYLGGAATNNVPKGSAATRGGMSWAWVTAMAGLVGLTVL